jgi:FkbM family methyltransferase
MTDVVQMRGHSFFPLGPAPFVIDLGANDGKLAQEVADAYPDATLLLVEGDPYLVQQLGTRFRARSGVMLYRGLVGAESREAVAFHLCEVPEGNSIYRELSEHWAPGRSRMVTAPMTTVTNLLTLAKPPRVDLLKVDIEGSEWDVLPTLTEREAALIDQITVEFHDFLDPSQRGRTEACITHLESLGYATRARAAEHEHGSPYFDCLFFRPRRG